jgi:tetratricopeptide (TPR) repeat protein
MSGSFSVIFKNASYIIFMIDVCILGNYGDIPYYDKALAINPHYDLALNNKGVALDNLGNHTGAILYYDKALTINPKYEDALYNKGYDLAALGNHTGAIEHFDKALVIDPHHAVIRNDEQATRTNVHRLIRDVVECWQNHVA